MKVFVSNNTGWRTHYLQGRYGNLGLLMSPDGLRGPWPHLPYALDNGAFGAYLRNQEFDSEGYRRALSWTVDKLAHPLWVVVPDVVADAEATFDSWDRWQDEVRGWGFPLAFAVQDGMTPDQVRARGVEADVVFVGGTTDWKEATLAEWCAEFPRVHVGRINGLRGLNLCAEAGAESCDGTGWFRGRADQLDGLIEFLRRQAPDAPPPGDLYWTRQGQPLLWP